MKKSILFLAAFAALVSCVKENPVEENPAVDTPAVEYQTITFEATAPSASSDDATKTTLVDGGLVHWCKGDAVKVMFIPINGSGAAFPGEAYDGASGVLTSTQEADAAASTSFYTDSWNWGVGSQYMGTGIALHPSSVYTYSHRNQDYFNNNATTVISYNLPSLQNAIENSFQNGVLFSYAEIADVDEFAENSSKLNFKNACALLRITLPAGASDVISLKVESSTAGLAGTYKVDPTNGYSGTGLYAQYYPKYPLQMIAESAENSVTLSAPAGETLKPQASYYIATWPGTHSNGLTFTFTNSAGLPLTKKVTQEVVLEASEIDHFNFKNSFTFEHVFEVSENSINFAGTASNGSFTVISSRDWTAESDSDWLTVSPVSGSSSMAAATVSLKAKQNNSGVARTAKIMVRAGEDTKVVTVTQEVFVAELSIERYGSWNILPAEGDFQFVNIKANTDWTLSCDQTWLTLAKTSGIATAGETVMLTAAENTTTSERTATLYLRDNANTVEKTFTVTQEGGKKTSGYKVVGVVLPEDMQTGKYYVIANYGDPTRYWTVGSASFYDLTLAGGFNANAYSNEFSIDQVFYVKEIYKGTGMTDTSYGHRAQISLFSLKSELGMAYITSTKTYRFNNKYGIYLNLGARYTGEYGNDVDMRDNSRTSYISTPDSDPSKITCSDSGFNGTGPRKWLIYEVQ